MQPWPSARPDPSLSQAKPSPFNAFKLQPQPQPQGAQTFHLNEGSRSDPVLVQRSIDLIPAAFRSCLMCSSEKTVFFCSAGEKLFNKHAPSIDLMEAINESGMLAPGKRTNYDHKEETRTEQQNSEEILATVIMNGTEERQRAH